MCPDSLNWALWVRFHGRYWYQSFIDGSNIWGVDSTDPWGPEMDHPPLGRSYLVVVPSYYMSCALILLTGLYGWDSMVDIDINPSSMGPIFGVWIGLTLGVPKWTNWALWVRFHGRYWYQSFIDYPSIGPQLFGSSAVVWYVMCPDSLNWNLWVRFHGRYWYQSFIDGSNIWGVDRTDPWGPEMDHPPLGRSYLVEWYVMCPDSLNWTLWVRFHGRYWYQSFIDALILLNWTRMIGHVRWFS